MSSPAPREVRLVSRPVGWPTPDDFELTTSDVPEVGDGQVRVRNVVMSVDPYMRGRMSAAKSYADPFALGEAMQGAAVGVVEESRADGIAEGDHVLHGLGWREVADSRVERRDLRDEPRRPPSYADLLRGLRDGQRPQKCLADRITVRVQRQCSSKRGRLALATKVHA